MAGQGQSYSPQMVAQYRNFLRHEHQLRRAQLDLEKQRRTARSKAQKLKEDISKGIYKLWRPPPPIPSYHPEGSTFWLPTNVYGEDSQGQPIYGPVSYDQYFPSDRWDLIGEDYKTTDLTHYQKKMFKAQGFTFKEKIGEGSYGLVWRCKQKISGSAKRQLACKVLHLQTYESSGMSVTESVAAILEESTILQRLSHRNIVQIADVLQHEDEVTGFRGCHVFQFMELCEGSLENLIRSLPARQMTEDEAQEWFRDVALGVQYLHQNNVSHMDLKLANILYTTDETTKTRVFKLTDFGVSKYFEPHMPSISTDFVGTLMFMAPEIGQAPYATKIADIYSLGITLASSLCYRHNRQITPVDFVGILRNWNFNVVKKYGVGSACADLIVGMCRRNPAKRMNIDQVLSSDWLAFAPLPVH